MYVKLGKHGDRQPIPAAVVSIQLALDDIRTRARSVLRAQLSKGQPLAALNRIPEIMPDAFTHQEQRSKSRVRTCIR
jgi:hypothetical protein